MLAEGRAGYEKTRGEPARAARRSDPVAEVRDALGRYRQSFAFEEIAKCEGPRVDRVAVHGERAGPLRIERRARFLDRDEDACLLETLADRGDPVRKPSGIDAQPAVGFDFGESADAVQRLVVRRVEAAAGKYVCVGDERGRRAALEHEYFGAFIGVAQQDQGGRGTRYDLRHGSRGAQAVRPERSFSFCALISPRMRSQSASDSLSSSVNDPPLAR